ncbi:MAG: S8 family serine peptidase [Bacteroidales bacterium]
MKRLFIMLSLMASLWGVNAQERLTREGSFPLRREEIQAIELNPERIRTIQRAAELGIPRRIQYPDGRIVAIRRIGFNGKPEYLTTSNLNAAWTISTNRVWKNGGAGLDLTGEGLVVGIWDAGVFRSSHREFGERGRLMNTEAEVLSHPTHVSGTIGARGIDGDARGMASMVILEAYDWENDLQEMDAAAAEGLLLSNHSYGYIVGFDYNSEEQRWEWWGDTQISQKEDYLFGYYHQEARAFDQVAYDHPGYLIVKSAGNDRGEGPEPGSEHYVWEDGEWISSNAVRQIDGGEDGFGTMGPISTAKNILVVGAVEDLPAGFIDPSGVDITGYSALGPTDDGRVKPDVVTNGSALYSTNSTSDSAYRFMSGTSMSAPGATGSMALLQEYHFKRVGHYLNAASLKGVVLHTADDAGNPGPDYTYGWGVVNTGKAAEVIGDSTRQRIFENLLADQDQVRISFFCDGSEPVKVTLCWTDPSGEVPAPSLNPTDRILVNDLDLRVIRNLDGQKYRPFVLDPVQPSKPASAGDNILDNVEQVVLSAPVKGFYEVVVSHKGVLREGNQSFSLIISGLSDDFYASGVYHLTGNNGEFYLTSASEYQPGMNAGWLITPENKLPVSLSFNFFETEENRDVIRIYDGQDGNAPLLAEFSGNLPDTDTLVTATGGTMWVHFTSDEQNQGGGFSAAYCTIPPEGKFDLEGEPYPCYGSEQTYLLTGEEGTLFRWTPPEGWEVLEKGEIFAKLLTGNGSGSLEVTPFNRCGESGKTDMALEPLFLAPDLSSFSGDTVFCSGEPGTLRVDSLPGATYLWQLPLNWQGSSDSHEINFISSLNQGEVLVSALNSCKQGDTLIIPTLVKSYPRESEIHSVSDKICQNSFNQFYLFAEKGVEYQWSVNPDWVISGDAKGDSVEVMVGKDPGSVYVTATNECGQSNSDRFFILTGQPAVPLLMESASIYNDLREIEVQNATSFTLIQWYLNGVLIDSPLANGPRYVAYVPGIYSVGVTNRDGCRRLQEPGEGISISGEDNLYSVHAGVGGGLVIYNSTEDPATVNVYNLQGQLQMIQEVDPGYNEVPTTLQGVQLVSVMGRGNLQVFRIFIR